MTDKPAPPPLISVIVPVYNVADFVGPCLASLKAQTFPDFEAIVIDDGSTDASRDRIVAAIAGDARFRLFAGPNGGLSAARNIGLTLARGRFITFLDGDDRFAPEFLAQMHAALATSGADWVACGLAYKAPGGDTGPTHSAIHNAPVLSSDPAPVLHDLSDWRDVVQHFPSAWNKLYRAELLAGLSFDVGTYYEDHAFFWQVAARSRALLHLPLPLYLQTIGRPGQITSDGGERVFDQFAVLDRLRGLLVNLPDRAGGDAAMAEIATRLVRERGAVIADPARMARFAARALHHFAEHGIDWRAQIPATDRLNRFDRALLGRRALCVVIPSNGVFEPLRASLESLAGQGLQDFDILLVSDGLATASSLASAAEAAGMDRRVTILGPDVRQDPQAGSAAERVAAARNRGLAATGADFVVFLDAGDLLLPPALETWLAAMMGSDADMGYSAFRIGDADGPLHQGVHDVAPLAETAARLGSPAALALHAIPSAKIFRRAFLLDHSMRFAPHALQSWQVTLQAAAQGKVLQMPGGAMIQGEDAASRSFWRGPPPSPDDLVAAVDLVVASLPPGWLGPAEAQHLLTRALWERLSFGWFDSPAARSDWGWQMQAIWQSRADGLADPSAYFDPYMSAGFRDFLAGTGKLP